MTVDMNYKDALNGIVADVLKTERANSMRMRSEETLTWQAWTSRSGMMHSTDTSMGSDSDG